ncbi:tetratricopeptide repeat protein [Paraburkholderia bryophila]|uniref:Tetratricopeptide (TPR) repeat protein n=1 Tax=Paraburkholderia bryophila TaxID=420952 RepID=A0A7Y9WAA4_9BURK|nr:tetratricopeptide repeat protein [Paraburkholderia bryophila]NYH16680.1 tetratricopeptide (TPR) repeat protein [Paraburkholderia bryophila]
MTVSDTLFSRIRRLLLQGNLIAASREIAAWSDMQPEDAGALTAHACLLRLRGHYREAGATLARSLAITRAFAPSAVEMARLARHDGLPARAHEWYEDAHRLAPDDDVWLDEWVELLWEMQRMDEAVQVATWLCEARPDSAKSWFLLGLSQQKKNAHTAALEAYQRAMTLDASYPVLRNNLAAVHYSLGELKLSLRICEEAIRADPGSSLPWTNASNAWLALREPGNALIAAERALRVDTGVCAGVDGAEQCTEGIAALGRRLRGGAARRARCTRGPGRQMVDRDVATAAWRR